MSETLSVQWLSSRLSTIKWLGNSSQIFAAGSTDAAPGEHAVYFGKYSEGSKKASIISVPVDGDVLGLSFADFAAEEEQIVVATSVGTVAFISYNQILSKFNAQESYEEQQSMSDEQNMEVIAEPIAQLQHKMAATCIDVRPLEQTVASAGDDGMIHVVSLSAASASSSVPIDKSFQADMYPINALRFVEPSVVLSASVSSRIFGFDLRTNCDRHSSVFTSPSSSPSVDVTSIAVHPSQPNCVLTTSRDGVLSLWDRAMPSAPFASYNAKTPLHEVIFHPNRPECVLSSSDQGLTHWSFSGPNFLSHSHQRQYQDHTLLKSATYLWSTEGSAAIHACDVAIDSGRVISCAEDGMINVLQDPTAHK